MTTTPSSLPVLVVGATGSLGGKVVDELLKRGKKVRALVRPTTDASRLENKGIEIARGDMLDLDSLVAAMQGADAVITQILFSEHPKARTAFPLGGRWLVVVQNKKSETPNSEPLAPGARRDSFRLERLAGIQCRRRYVPSAIS